MGPSCPPVRPSVHVFELKDQYWINGTRRFNISKYLFPAWLQMQLVLSRSKFTGSIPAAAFLFFA